MEVRVIERGPLILAGLDFYGNPFATGEGWTEENQIGKLWSRFSAFMEEKGALVGNIVNPDRGYEAHIEPDEYGSTKNFYVMVGVEVSGIGALPPELCARMFPGGPYAICTLAGQEITSNWSDDIFKKWLPQSGYIEAHKFLLEYYDGDRFKGMDRLEESELDVYVPIKESS